ncbi:MAG: hypothetical protein ACRDS9_25375 [Pseudonocardiaceae bacterium]
MRLRRDAGGPGADRGRPGLAQRAHHRLDEHPRRHRPVRRRDLSRSARADRASTGLFYHHAEANGLGVVCPSGLASIRPGNNDSFESRYDDSYVRVPIGDRVRHLPYRVAAIRPDEAELLHAAWSEATFRCAAYFGIHEDMIPSVLVLSLREKVAVLARLPEDASLYSFCKGLTAGLGDAPRRADLLRAERAELTESLGLLRYRQEWAQDFDRYVPASTPPLDRVREQLAGLDRHLELVADIPDIDTELVD